jgi:hypothetical protein
MAQPPFAGGCDSLLQSGSAVVVVEARRSCGGRGNRPPRWSLAGMISGFLGESPPMVDMRRREVITLLVRGSGAAPTQQPAKLPGIEILWPNPLAAKFHPACSLIADKMSE